MKLWDRIVTLTANPAIDVALHADVLAHEALGRVLEEKEEAGGRASMSPGSWDAWGWKTRR